MKTKEKKTEKKKTKGGKNSQTNRQQLTERNNLKLPELAFLTRPTERGLIKPLDSFQKIPVGMFMFSVLSSSPSLPLRVVLFKLTLHCF